MDQDTQAEVEFDEIVGESSTLKSVLRKAINASKSDAAVLITGEKGTGKELIARAIHRVGNRRRQSFIKFECSRIAPGQMEAALFGRDKGRLEAANPGILLLKRIECITPDLQPKLLQVFEHKQFRRSGETTRVPIDIRLIATMSAAGQKAEDSWLYKGLSPKLELSIIRVPPLRERRSDIPLLVWYFVTNWARMLNKPVEVISTETMDSLVNYSWPDNVRELENVIERSVRSTEGPELILKAPIENEKRA